MTLVMRCDEKDRLVGYLYGEGSPAERGAVEAHLARCAPCAAELNDLKAVRVHLAGWNAPETGLGFHVTRDPIVASPARTTWVLPAWAQAAAALLVLAAGAGLSNLQVEYGSRGLSVRTGWGSEATATPAGAPARGQVVAGVTRADLAALEDRLRADLLPAANTVAPAAPVLTGSSRDPLPQVRALLEESELRHQKELAVRLAEVVRDFENQRRADLVRIDQNMRQIEGLTGEQAVGQREMMNYLLHVSQRR
jgi:hypothetical protein